MMRYLRFDEISGTGCVAETEIPNIADNEVLVKVHAFGVNRADLLQKEGKYPPPKGASSILGMEVSGVVVNVGKNVETKFLNLPVCAMITGGGYAEYVPVEVEHLIPVPEDMDLTRCGGLPEVFLTAYQSLLDIGKLVSGQKVLIHAGASGVGTAAIQLAKNIGCSVAVTTSSQTKNDACTNLGADICINYKEHHFDDVLKEKQFFPNVIVDVVGEGNLQRNINIAAMDCVVVQLAMLAGRYAGQLDLAKLLGKRIQLQGSTLRNRSSMYKASLVKGFLSDFGEAINKGLISPVVDSVYDVETIDEAHFKMAQNQNIGKLIIRW